ncbi:MAG: hypothetical protein V4683_05705 [Bacteroidota bacterium]
MIKNKAEIDKILYGVDVNSFNRFQTFLGLIPMLKGSLYWYALRSSYVSSDNLFKFSGIIKSCFLKDELQKKSLMTIEERNYLKLLPDLLTIYRGMTIIELRYKNFGCSWTLKKEKAEFYAFNYWRNFSTRKKEKIVHEITINKSDVIAFFNGSNEFEIIYLTPKAIQKYKG